MGCPLGSAARAHVTSTYDVIQLVAGLSYDRYTDQQDSKVACSPERQPEVGRCTSDIR
jgi:hypothetical protein